MREFRAFSTVGLCLSDIEEWLRGDDEPENSVSVAKEKIIIKDTWAIEQNLPISPFSLELDSVKLGVPSVHVGVEPSIEAGGVQARAPRDP